MRQKYLDFDIIGPPESGKTTLGKRLFGGGKINGEDVIPLYKDVRDISPEKTLDGESSRLIRYTISFEHGEENEITNIRTVIYPGQENLYKSFLQTLKRGAIPIVVISAVDPAKVHHLINYLSEYLDMLKSKGIRKWYAPKVVITHIDLIDKSEYNEDTIKESIENISTTVGSIYSQKGIEMEGEPDVFFANLIDLKNTYGLEKLLTLPKTKGYANL